MAKVTRGIRNNNPGNIRRNGSNWRGLATLQKDMRFCQFVSMKWGVRAIIYLIRKYVTNYRLNYVGKIISRWAPPEDGNNTTVYIKRCALRIGGYCSKTSKTDKETIQAGLNYEFTADDFKLKDGFLSSDELFALVAEICKVESGYNLTRGDFEEALSIL